MKKTFRIYKMVEGRFAGAWAFQCDGERTKPTCIASRKHRVVYYHTHRRRFRVGDVVATHGEDGKVRCTDTWMSSTIFVRVLNNGHSRSYTVPARPSFFDSIYPLPR